MLSLYRQGDFTDLCRGPHVPSTGKIKGVQADEAGRRLLARQQQERNAATRVRHGFHEKEELEAYLHMLEEAEKRDHRKLGQQLDLFHMQDEAPGSVFWLLKGWRLFQSLINYMRQRQEQAGYVEVNTPDVMDRGLWETSGHWFNYRENMFTTQTEDERVRPQADELSGAVSMYAHGLHSYRDLPMRMAEFGKVHRLRAVRRAAWFVACAPLLPRMTRISSAPKRKWSRNAAMWWR